jgi:hypothetical protein
VDERRVEPPGGTPQPRPAPRFSWRCSRCRRFCDEEVHFGWGPAWAKCSSCLQTIDIVVKRELDGRVVAVCQAKGVRAAIAAASR